MISEERIVELWRARETGITFARSIEAEAREECMQIPMKYKRMEFNAQLQEEVVALKLKVAHWMDKKLARFREDDCWIWQGDGSDDLDSLVCPVVIKPQALTDILAERDALALQNKQMREALRFYAEGEHFLPVDPSAWDTVSGEPQNFLEDDANTVTVEDGSLAKQALQARHNPGIKP